MTATVPTPSAMPFEQRREINEYESAVRQVIDNTKRWTFEEYVSWVLQQPQVRI